MKALHRIAEKVLNKPGMLGKAVKDFTPPSTGGTPFRLSSTRGKTVVLYFYPKDNTPGCSTEGADFRDRRREFVRAGFEIYAISRDSVKLHGLFKTRMKFPFDLLSDAEETVCAQFGVVKLKVPGYAEEVLNFVKAL